MRRTDAVEPRNEQDTGHDRSKPAIMDTYPILHSLFIGQPKTITDARGTWTSSIYRDRVEAPVPLHKEGLAGDKAAQPYHGGPDAAVCVHLLDHYRFWNA